MEKNKKIGLISLGCDKNRVDSEKALALCKRKIIIPMRQNTESLNAAAAAAILIWEKQKGAII